MSGEIRAQWIDHITFRIFVPSSSLSIDDIVSDGIMIIGRYLWDSSVSGFGAVEFES
jgi:hypothetical protein